MRRVLRKGSKVQWQCHTCCFCCEPGECSPLLPRRFPSCVGDGTM